MRPKPRTAAFSITASLALLAGCAGAPAPYRELRWAEAPRAGETVYTEVGTASWYGDDFHGKATSNGEIYDMYGRTVAHRSLPFGTVVRITNLENGRQTVGRVNDRGPFAKNRIVDLTYTLAKELGMVGDGTARVRVEALSVAADYPKLPRYALQVGSFQVVENAQELARTLRGRFPQVRVVEGTVGGRTYHRVRVGLYASRDDSGGDLRDLRRMDLEPLVVGVD